MALPQKMVTGLIVPGLMVPGLILGWHSAVIADSVTPARDDVGTTVDRQGNRYIIRGGSRSRDGENLFHSFERLGLDANEIARFLSRPDIRNILGRVTGGQASVIDGLLQVTGGPSNLFLMNPAGIIFGANARLDLPAAFTATTATGIGFSNQWFDAIASTDYASLVGSPTAFLFNTPAPGAIVNAGELSVSQGQDLSLLGGTVVNTGRLSAPGGEITVATVPGSHLIRLSQAGMLLNLEIQPLVDATGHPLPFTPLSLPQLLTGGNATSATGVVVNADGSLSLLSGLPVQTGDVVATELQTETATLAAQHNLTIAPPSTAQPARTQTTGNLNLLAGNTVQILDTPDQPAIVSAGGQLLIQGQQAIDIFALNHPNSGLFSGRDMVLRSPTPVGGDAHYYSGGNFRIEQLDGQLGELFSPDDPIIRAIGDVSLASYSGASLHIIAGGSVTIPGFVFINGPDTFNSLNETVILSDGTAIAVNGAAQPTLDIRAGVTGILLDEIIPAPTIFPVPPVLNPLATSADITIGNIGMADGGLVLLTNQANPNPALPGGTITVNGNISAIGGTVAIDARSGINVTGDIDTSTIDSIVVDSGEILLLGGVGNITAANLITDSFNGNGGDITIDTAGNITIANITSTAGLENTEGGDIEISSVSGNVLITGELTTGDANSASDAGEIEISAFGNVNIQGLNVDGAVISTASNTGSGADVEITSDTGFVSVGNSLGGVSIVTTSSSTDPDDDAGDIDLNAAGDIFANELNTRAFGMGGEGGEINLTSVAGEIRTGLLDSGDFFSAGDAGEITVTAFGDIIITAGGTPDTTIAAFSNGGSGADITLTSTNGAIDTSAGAIQTSPFTLAGFAGDITMNALGDITTSDLFTLIVQPTNFNDAGRISLTSTAGSINTSLGSLVSTAPRSNGGEIILTADDEIQTGLIAAQSETTDGDPLAGGDITITTTNGNINTLDLTTFSRSNNTGNANLGGDITLSAVNGAITVQGNVNSRSFADTGGARTPGAIRFTAGQGINLTGELLADLVTSVGSTEPANAIQLTTTQGDITVSQGIFYGATNIPSGGSLTADAPGTINFAAGLNPRGANTQIGSTIAPNQVLLPSLIETGSGDFSVRSAADLTFTSNVLTTGGNFSLESTGDLTLTNEIVTTGGRISINGNRIDTSAAPLNSSVISGNSGAIALTAQSDIITTDLTATSDNGDGADITLTSTSGGVNTSAGTIATVSINGAGGAIAITAQSDITLGDLTFGSLVGLESGALSISTPAILDLSNATLTSNGADISLGTSTALNTVLLEGTQFDLENGNLSLFVNDALTFNATINTTGGNVSIGSTEELTIETDIVTQGGNITLTANTLNAQNIILDSSASDRGGDMVLTAQDSIRLGDVILGATESTDNQTPGRLQVSTTGDLLLNNLTANGVNINLGTNSDRLQTVEFLGEVNTGGGQLRLFTTENFTASGELQTEGGDLLINSNGEVELSATAQTEGGELRLRGETIMATDLITSGEAGGVIELTATEGEIQVGDLDSSAEDAGGDITLTGNGITTGDVITRSRNGGDSGSVSFNSLATITTGDINTNAVFGEAGGIELTAVEDISTGNLSASADTSGGQAGTITVTSATGTIVADPETTFSTTGIFGDGGNVNLMARQRIAVGTIDTSSQQGNGGNVLIDPRGDVSVTAINAQGGESGRGGEVDITAGRFFRATGQFRDRNNRTASISTAGGIGGGAVTIRHGGNGETPFIVGDASENGVAAAITSGADLENTIAPRQSFRFSYEQGNLQLVTGGSPNGDPNPPEPPDPNDLPDEEPAEFIDLPGAEPPIGDLPTIEVDTIPDFEEDHTNAFVDYLGIAEVATKGLTSIRQDLLAITEATGVRPAVIYVLFVPQELDSSPASPSPDSTLPQQDSDRLQLLLITSKGRAIRKSVSVTREEVRRTADKLRGAVAFGRSRPTQYLPPAQQLYQWLVAPLEADLQEQEIQNLTFILDAGLRSLPLAALHNGQGFIIERFSVGLMPSLSLTDTRYVDIRNTQVLAMGASEFGEDLADLPAVPIEVSAIADFWGGEFVINEEFTPTTLITRRDARPFGIVHLATHGKFRPGELQNSFIQFWNQRLRLDQIRQLQLTDPPVELLVLSACQTALGDELAELGFAGAAANAGVKSVLASLWQVSDAGTLGFMSEFYRQLRQVPIKAEAVRQAQLAMVRGDVQLQDGQLLLSTGEAIDLSELRGARWEQLSHPYYWSAFTLIGNPW